MKNSITKIILGLLITCLNGFSHSKPPVLKPIVEEYRLGDTSSFKLRGVETFKHIDTSTKANLDFFWREFSEKADQDYFSDSLKMINMLKTGYFFKSKSILIEDSINLPLSDIYLNNRLVAKNVIRLGIVQYDSVFNSSLSQADIYFPGKSESQFYYKDKILSNDDLHIWALHPKLLNGKPLYISRSPSINKSDSLIFFNRTSPFENVSKEPFSKMSYEFLLYWGTEVLFRFNHPFSCYWSPFPEFLGFETVNYSNGWIFQVSYKLIIDGINISEKYGYSECFNTWKLNDKPFFFYRKEHHYGVQIGDYCFPEKYDSIYHNGCCESTVLNPRYYGEQAVSFFAIKKSKWYLVIVHF